MGKRDRARDERKAPDNEKTGRKTKKSWCHDNTSLFVYTWVENCSLLPIQVEWDRQFANTLSLRGTQGYASEIELANNPHAIPPIRKPLGCSMIHNLPNRYATCRSRFLCSFSVEAISIAISHAGEIAIHEKLLCLLSTEVDWRVQRRIRGKIRKEQ